MLGGVSGRQDAFINDRCRIVVATIEQALQLAAPSNFALTNPEVLAKTHATGGANLAAGWRSFIRDVADKPADSAGTFVVGRDLAATPGEIVFRNALIELIRYAPSTDVVGAEPVLITPAWIMKYYILDLSPGNSLVRWLVAQGRTVFMISWRNPGAEMRDTSFDDYRTNGVMAALDAVSASCGSARVHAVGYCLGGTLLAITAAAMARAGDDRLASLSLLAAQTDFSDPGPLGLFITEDQLTFLDDVMQAQGYLDKAQMEAVFQVLGSEKLIWARGVQRYLMGERDAPFDLMAWNADGTRLPARMHGEYLRSLYLNNDLAEGRLEADGRPVQLPDVKLPMFVVGTEHDEVAPWRSVFKLHHLNDGALTFVLTSGGHNAGIVSEPGHPRRHFRLRTRGADVLELEVYCRTAVIPTVEATAELHRALAGQGLLVVVVTSVEVLQSLLEHVSAADGARLRGRTLLVPGPRVAAAAAQLGWNGPIVAAATAEDEAMFAALGSLTTGTAPPA